MTATIIPFEHPPVAGASPYELVEIINGLSFGASGYLVALAGPRGDGERGRDPWTSIDLFDRAEDAVEAAASASRRHGCIPIWDGAGIIPPASGSRYFVPIPKAPGTGDAA